MNNAFFYILLAGKRFFFFLSFFSKKSLFSPIFASVGFFFTYVRACCRASTASTAQRTQLCTKQQSKVMSIRARQRKHAEELPRAEDHVVEHYTARCVFKTNEEMQNLPGLRTKIYNHSQSSFRVLLMRSDSELQTNIFRSEKINHSSYAVRQCKIRRGKI